MHINITAHAHKLAFLIAVMKLFAIILFLSGSVIVLAAAAPVNLQAYPFSFILYDQNNQYYGLHWNFTRETQSIYFAVNVSTTGWVGFGLSPNGQMPASDVVIGWVNGGQTYFHVSQLRGLASHHLVIP